MRKISANYIFTGKEVLKNGIIVFDKTGQILNIINTNGKIQEKESLEFYSGVIVPGFINAHCHIELSHMKGIINNNTVDGLAGFIDEIISKRNFPKDLENTIQKADREMQIEGIVAVGDISNTDDSFNTKKNSKIYYHTFVETFTVSNDKAEEAFNIAKENINKLDKFKLARTIVPHSAYTVPDELYSKISNFEKEKTKITSIHNQETKGEDFVIKSQTGKLADVLIEKGFKFKDFTFIKNNAIEHTLSHQNYKDNILLIHNTFSTQDNIKFTKNFSENIFLVLCPLSNLYIEKQLPNLSLFFNNNVKTCIGTDSYASNTKLSILEELKIITKHFPEIKFEKLIEAACLNGAKALKIENKFGSFEIGKTPGINLISNFDYKKMSLSEKSTITVLA